MSLLDLDPSQNDVYRGAARRSLRRLNKRLSAQPSRKIAQREITQFNSHAPTSDSPSALCVVGTGLLSSLESLLFALLFDKKQRGALRAYNGEGWLGQYVVVVPDAGLVAVRMRAFSDDAAKDPMAFSYREFIKDVFDLTKRSTSAHSATKTAPAPR